MNAHSEGRRSLAVPARGAMALALAATLSLVSAGVAGATPDYMSHTNAGNTGNSFTINAPSGIIAGNLLLAQITFEKGSDVTTLTPPSGWTLIIRTNNGTNIGQAIFRKIATGSEPGTYTWTLNNSPKVVGTILRYKEVDNSNPIVASAGNTGTSSSLTAPSVAGIADSTLVVLFGDKKNEAIGVPGGMTERVDFGTANEDMRVEVADQVLTVAGATGTRVATSTSSDPWVAHSIVLRWVGPTLAELESFGAASRPDGVALHWETATEVNNRGFDLYRSEAPFDPGIRLNATLVPSATPGGFEGARYAWLDRGAVPGRRYTYRLESVDSAGRVEEIGRTALLFSAAPGPRPMGAGAMEQAETR